MKIIPLKKYSSKKGSSGIPVSIIVVLIHVGAEQLYGIVHCLFAVGIFLKLIKEEYLSYDLNGIYYQKFKPDTQKDIVNA